MGIKEFNYDYKKYQTKALTVEKLDELMAFVTASTGVGTYAAIVTFFKIALSFMYLYTRNKLLDNELAVLKQEYEKAMSNSHGNINEI